MRWLGDHPFHTLLLLTDRPAEWAAWQIASMPVLLATGAGLIWTSVTGVPSLGWGIALGLLALALADWGLLASLPRWGVSFGAVQPPLLGLVLFRWLVVLVSTPFAIRWPLPTLALLAAVQLTIWGLAAYGTLIEPFRVQISRVEIPSRKLSNPATPLRIVQLSDLHVERLTGRDLSLPSLVADLAPDILVLTGDLLSTSYNQDPRALADLEKLLIQFHAPGGVYAVWGTVEVDVPHLLRPLLKGLGIVVLENTGRVVQVNGHRLWLMGVSCTRDLEVDGANLRTLLEQAPPGTLTLLLYHMPDLMPQAASLGVDLYLAGHTHGGQWRVPGFGAVLTSSRFWKRYEGGLYCEGDTHLYVSRGLGLEGFGTPRARFFCPPEVVALTLSGAGEEQ
jgi:predicted MPP superfamily phosphohydrolase